ncbi:MAG: GNAT family N-acetyltransferase [Anaerolineae bacterium]
MASIRYQIGCDDVDWQVLHDTLIADDFHNGRTVAQYQQSFENSHTVIIAYDGDKLVGTVRALSDGVCNAYLVDVWTLTTYRRQGIARAMMTQTLQQLRGQHVYLWTDDQHTFYEAIGMQRDENASGYFIVVGDWLDNDSAS